MKRVILALLSLIFITSSVSAHNPKVWRKMKQDINFFWASDLDRGGCYDQKVIANLMGELAGVVKPECIISTGDTHHGNGVKSANDDDWQGHLTDMYNHRNLAKRDWWAIAGNHEYQGNSQALIDYSKVNPYWNMPAKYYTKVFKKGDVSIRFVMLDTTPLINRYRESEKYPDAAEQNKEEQLEWLNKVLSEAKEDWVIVAGHHLRIFLRSWSGNPSVSQLQSIFDVSNPQYISVGNKNLNPSFSHNLSMHYNLSKVDKGITFMWMFNAQMQQNYISSSTWSNPNGFDLPEKFGDLTIPTRKDEQGHEIPYRPKEVTSYENMDGYYSVRTHVSLGLPLSFMKCNLNISGGVSYNRIPSAIYATGDGNILQNMIDHVFETNYANNIGYSAGATIGSNISENLDFTISWNGTYNQAWNTIGRTEKNNYFNHSVNGNLKWTFLKRLTLTAGVSYVQYLGFTDNYNEDYVLCNLYLGCKVFKNRRGEVQVGVNDLLNQNTMFVRSTGSGYTQNSWNSCIGRYFSVQFVYNLRHFGKKGSTRMSDYNYKESSGSVGVNRGTTSSGWGYGPRR